MFELFAWLGWALAGLGWWAFSKECAESRYWEMTARDMHHRLEDHAESMGRDVYGELRLVK